MQKNAYTEKYSREDIFRLDNFVCYLCREHVSPEERTIDHIVPLSKGGGDGMTNVALTHWSCNYKKRANTISEITDMFPNLQLPARVVENVGR